MSLFKKILVANRGEIAVRILGACREMGIPSVAVFSAADRASLHVQMADEARAIGPAESKESYLNIDRVLEAARATGADAIHPGYGFLAENPAFARACEDAGITFIGPRSETIAQMGEKTSARKVARDAGVPVVPGSAEALSDEAEVMAHARRLGFPVMLKAAAGGGGKGLRMVESQEGIQSALERARSEAKTAFGDDRVYVEKALCGARHVEIQILSDHKGDTVHLFERECSVQRRHQKVIEESPSPRMSPGLRERMGGFSIALARAVSYRNAGTLEFLVDREENAYFLEMNTRLQVEHPVTEMVTGKDIVRLQIEIAAGLDLPFRQEDLGQRGHAIECRIYAEDPERAFVPSPGRITALRVPTGPGIRHDTGIYPGYSVPIHYDPLLAKLIVHAGTRAEAVARLERALSEYRVLGIQTTLSFHRSAVRQKAFREGTYDTGFLETVEIKSAGEADVSVALAAAAIRALRDRRGQPSHPATSSGVSPWWSAGLRESQRGRT